MTMNEAALIKRINRKLAREGEALRTTRGGQPEWNLGRHYILDTHTNCVTAYHIDDLESLGRELGVI
jgi:hypothetical protein